MYVIVQPVGWRPLSELIGRPELADDPEWATPRARLPKLNKMFQLIEEWSSTLPKWEVLERLNAHNIPCGPILSTKEIIEDDSLVANEMVVTVPHPERGEFVTVGSPLKLLRLPRPGDQFAAARRAQRRGLRRRAGPRRRGTAAAQVERGGLT
ncbi:Formyl-CoA:oxalate CoA-transferase [Streptomyces violaceorubidus]